MAPVGGHNLFLGPPFPRVLIAPPREIPPELFAPVLHHASRRAPVSFAGTPSWWCVAGETPGTPAQHPFVPRGCGGPLGPRAFPESGQTLFRDRPVLPPGPPPRRVMGYPRVWPPIPTPAPLGLPPLGGNPRGQSRARSFRALLPRGTPIRPGNRGSRAGLAPPKGEWGPPWPPWPPSRGSES